MLSLNNRGEKMSDNNLNNAEEKSNGVKKFFEVFGNIFGLNICFVIGCLPIITIGASITALYSMCIRLQENEEETVLVGFIHEFKRSFKQATLTWLLLILALVVMGAEYLVISLFSGIIVIVYTAVLVIEVLFVALTLPFLFPLIARYNNGFLPTIFNAFLLSVGYFGSWIKITVAWVAPFMFFVVMEPIVFIYTWYLWLMFVFALIAYGTSYTIRKVFRINEEKISNANAEANDQAVEIENDEDNNN